MPGLCDTMVTALGTGYDCYSFTKMQQNQVFGLSPASARRRISIAPTISIPTARTSKVAKALI